MRKCRHAISFVAFGVIVAGAVYYIGSLGVRTGPPNDRVNLSMQVADVSGLVVDCNVFLRGVPVGKVTGIDTSMRSAIVHFYIDKRYPIPVDSEVRLENLSALGESYIGFVPRTEQGQMFQNGQQVATQDVKQPASISELATSVVHVLNQLNPEPLNRLLDEADRALPDPQTVLPNLTRASALLRGTVKSMNGRGSEVLANFQTLLQNAGFVGPILAETSPNVLGIGKNLGLLYTSATTIDYYSDGLTGNLNVVTLFGRIQNFLDTRAPDLKVIAQTLMPNIQGIAAASMNLDTGQILSNMLDTIPEDGTITLHVTTPSP